MTNSLIINAAIIGGSVVIAVKLAPYLLPHGIVMAWQYVRQLHNAAQHMGKDSKQ